MWNLCKRSFIEIINIYNSNDRRHLIKIYNQECELSYGKERECTENNNY